jgi:hypothetical protein
MVAAWWLPGKSHVNASLRLNLEVLFGSKTVEQTLQLRLLLLQMRPPVTAIMACLLLNEPLGLTGAAGCLISVAGVTILAHPPFLFGGHSSWGQQRLLGTLRGVASTLFASGTSYTIRR